MPPEQRTDTTPPSTWRQRGYCLTVFGPDDRLVTCVDLTEDQADAIGRACWPGDDVDGVGEYPLQFVYLSPTNGE